MQGYKVYQDPKGTHTLDKPKSNIQATYNNAINNDDEFKKRIVSLNEEIKDLSDELATVKCTNNFVGNRVRRQGASAPPDIAVIP